MNPKILILIMFISLIIAIISTIYLFYGLLNGTVNWFLLILTIIPLIIIFTISQYYFPRCKL